MACEQNILKQTKQQTSLNESYKKIKQSSKRGNWEKNEYNLKTKTENMAIKKQQKKTRTANTVFSTGFKEKRKCRRNKTETANAELEV